LSQLPIDGTTAEAMNIWQYRGLVVNARLQPGASLKQANLELKQIAQSIMRQHPDVEKDLGIEAYPEATLRVNAGDPSTRYIVAGLFLSLGAMVLLLACVNVANLVLARATVREREMAIHTALGARRSRLIGQMVTESVTLALMGGAMGVVLGTWASSALVHVDVHADLPLALSFEFDWRIFLYSFAIALLAGVVVGIVPALRIAKANVNTVLHEGSRGVAVGVTGSATASSPSR
jgi:putative ABC transport system permease protein